MSHQGKSVYVPPYARFVYGPTKCYFVHMCVCVCVCLSQPRSFSLSSIHSFIPNVLVPKSVFAPRMDSAQRDADQRIS